jgi:hypothetical protein
VYRTGSTSSKAQHMEIQNSDCLQFIKKSVKHIFYKDTNFRIENIFVCLYYPTIEVQAKEKTIYIDCTIKNIRFKPDKKSIIEFLEEYPEYCKSIIDSTPDLQKSFNLG